MAPPKSPPDGTTGVGGGVVEEVVDETVEEFVDEVSEDAISDEAELEEVVPSEPVETLELTLPLTSEVNDSDELTSEDVPDKTDEVSD